MTTKLTSVWFAYVGWAKPDQDEADAHREHVAFPIPYDSYESALWALRSMVENFWIENVWGAPDAPEPPDMSAMDEKQIAEVFAGGAVIYDDWVLVEIREVQIINHTATGWRTLNLKAADDALRILSAGGGFLDTSGSIQAHEHQAFLAALPTHNVPAHRFQSGLSCNNEVTRCVVTHNGKDYFGPWRGDEASALKAALLMIQDKE